MANLIQTSRWNQSAPRGLAFSDNERLYLLHFNVAHKAQSHVNWVKLVSGSGIASEDWKWRIASVRSSWVDNRLVKSKRINSWNCSGDVSSLNLEPFQPIKAPDTVTSFSTQSTTGALDPWVSAGGARPPLSHEEEVSFSADVQDLMFLESRKCELQKFLGRIPTDSEWADNLGVPLPRLYARLGKGRSAKRKMVAANLRLVSSIAEQYQDRGLSHQELCQAGLTGLLKSTERYNSSRNTKFSSYAYFWIRERVATTVQNFKHVLRVSHGVYTSASVFLRRRDEFHVRHWREPTLSELADVCNVDSKRVRQVLDVIKPAKSINVERLEGEVPAEYISGHPWFVIKQAELKSEVARALDKLPEREKQVVQMRFGFDGESRTLKQVGEALGLHLETIRLTEKKALERLKGGYLIHYLSDNLWFP